MSGSSIDLLFKKPVKFTEKISIHVPTVEEVAYTENYSLYVQPLVVTTRQMFSALDEVDELEERFPTLWQMAFDEEGSQIMAQMFDGQSGIDIIIDAISFWTKLEPETFQSLSNNKMINKGTNWVIDENVFDSFCNSVKEIIGYEQDQDLIAPKNMSERKKDIWKKTYKGRLRNKQKNTTTLADRIIILSISMESYIPIDEIRNMSIYHFNKLNEMLSEKESYQKQWETKLSPKFESGSGAIKHWKEKI